MRTKKALLLAVAAAATLLAAVAIVTVTRIDPADLLAVATARVQKDTGRELKVDGPVGFALSLVPTVSLEGVRLRNAPWGSRPDMLSARRVEIEIALLPLLSGKVDIRGLTLIDPDLLLETNAAGENNWTFGRTDAKASEPVPGAGQQVDIRHARVENGVLAYRSAGTGATHTLEIPTLTATSAGARTEVEVSARLNGEPLQSTVVIDRGSVPPTAEIATKATGLVVSAKIAPGAAAGSSSGHLEVEIKDWPGAYRLAAKANPPRLPALRAATDFSAEPGALRFDGLKANLGNSSFTGSARLVAGKGAPTIEAKLDAPLVDLAELRAPVERTPAGDGRIFSADPLPVAALRDLNGRLEARIVRLALRDGKSVANVELLAVADHGRITADPFRLAIEGRELRGRASIDASSGKSLALDLGMEGSGISLGALGALLDLTGTPEGSPTDVGIRFAGRGDSMRTLMAGANGDVRIVVGPGRLKNRAVNWGADVTELLNALNPARAAEPYTELKCAVIRLPIRQGVARIDNSIAMETAKVNVIAAGVIDLRSETIDLGFRTKAATGLGLDLGGLASLARLRGSFAAPQVALDMAGTAQAATQLGLAAATGGLSLLAGGVLAERVPDQPCQAALTGTASRAQGKTAPPPSGVVDNLIGGFKKLFGR